MGLLLGGFSAGCMLLALPWPVLPGAGLLGVALVLGIAAIVRWLGILHARSPPHDLESGAAGYCVPAGLQVSGFGRRSFVRLVALAGGVMLGLVWSCWHHGRALDERLSLPPGSAAVRFDARVLSQPEPAPAAPGQGPAVRFQVRVLDSPRLPQGLRPGAVLRLTWQGAPEMRQGDRWRLTASIKGPWGYANPAGFDFERWMLGWGLQGSGYVRRGVLLQPAPPHTLAEIRSGLNDFVMRLELDYPGLVQALLTGTAGAVTPAHWALFRNTGTVHLMVVSGLHVGLAATAGYLVGLWVARAAGLAVPGLLLWVNARRLAALAGVGCCTLYVLLSGAGVPAQRAWLMSVPALLLLAWGWRIRSGGALILAAAVLLLSDPLRVHLQGFWLSLGAVALLLLGFGGRYGPMPWWRALLRSQWIIVLGLTPLLSGLTQVFAATGWLANMLAVPVVSLLLVPLVLTGGAAAFHLPVLAEMLFRLADGCLGVLLGWLDWLGSTPLLHLRGAAWTLAVAQAAAVWLVVGRPVRGWLLLWPAAMLWLAGLPGPLQDVAPATRGAPYPAASGPDALPSGAFRVLALDVGQGTAVILDTASHRLLFDTGPAFPGGFETGSAVVVPNLVATGPGLLDTLVLSHADLDHIGGAPYVRRHVPARRVFSSFPAQGAVSCDGRTWQRDGVRFQLLSPDRPEAPADNERSCVLLVSGNGQRALIAGDIGAAVERSLLRMLPGPVSLMFAPHHGSGASSTRALVRVARPRLLFVSAALGNRYGHPHPDVLGRYRSIGARVFQTGVQGALLWRSDRPYRVVRWRPERGAYWRSQVDRLAGRDSPSSS